MPHVTRERSAIARHRLAFAVPNDGVDEFPFLDSPFGDLANNAVSLLDFPEEPFAVSGNDVKVVIRELPSPLHTNHFLELSPSIAALVVVHGTGSRACEGVEAGSAADKQPACLAFDPPHGVGAATRVTPEGGRQV